MRMVLSWPTLLASAQRLAASATMQHLIFARSLVFGLTVLCMNAFGLAQNWQDKVTSSVSSDQFLQEIPAGSFPSDSRAIPFQVGDHAASNYLKPEARQAAFSTPGPGHPSEIVTKAQYQTPATEPTIGSGVAIVSRQPNPPMTANSLAPRPTLNLGWQDKLGLDTTLPNFVIGYESIHFRRSNDSVGPYSQGDGLDGFAHDVSGRYTFSRLLGYIDRIEFKFTGPLHWDRQSATIGPVNSNLPASFAPAFDSADRHHQSHSVRLSSFELNRSSSGDDLSQFFYGLRFFDHEERYRLEATHGSLVNQFRIETNNFLAGGQIGMNFFRPVSQRLSFGFGTAMGLYGDFATGFLNATNGLSTLADANERGVRITSMFEGCGLIQFRISQNILASAGYEAWYFTGLATSAGQPITNLTPGQPFSLQTGDDQLFRGWTIGLSARF